jgi:hypothetical protein
MRIPSLHFGVNIIIFSKTARLRGFNKPNPEFTASYKYEPSNSAHNTFINREEVNNNGTQQ